ncbi:MAG: hypothetical protein EZS28_042701, partial [Streblomastix strix]
CVLIGLNEIQDEYRLLYVQNHVFSKSKATTVQKITKSHILAFYISTYTNNNGIKLLIISKNPFQALFRLFDHPNIFVVNRAIISIYNILNAGSNTTSLSEKHPHFATIQECDGINQLFNLFKRNDITKYTKDRSALCIGNLFRAQQIPSNEMKTEIIAHLKALLNGFDDWGKNAAILTIKDLAQNVVNRAEIEKDGFIIPD